MSLIAKSTYMGAKSDLVMSKVTPLVAKFNDICTAGVNLLEDLVTKLTSLIDQLNALVIKALTYLTKQEKKLQVFLTKQRAKLEAKIDRLVTRLTTYKTQACTQLSSSIDQSIAGISGISINTDITPPDPLTGMGGSISITPTPDLIDESTLLVDQTLTDPTTIVTGGVVGTSVSGGPVTGTSVSNSITIT